MKRAGLEFVPDRLLPFLTPLISAAEEAGRGSEPAHDFLHVCRVAANACSIADVEAADVAIVLAAAFLHELRNLPKDHPDSARSGEFCADEADTLLRSLKVDREMREAVCYAIRVHPFSLGITPETPEAKILQDADRLDAIGAIGIARVFATGAAMNRPFYSQDDPFCIRRPPDDKTWTLDHFYRKLLRLPEQMHTAVGREMAEERAAFLRVYLEQLRREISET